MLEKLYKSYTWILPLVDVFLLVGVYLFANFTRFDFNIIVFRQNAPQLWASMSVVIGVKVFFVFYFDLYTGMWRYTGIKDLISILKAASASFLVTLFIFTFFLRLLAFSKAVLLIDLVLTITTLAGVRILIRIYFEYFQKTNPYSPTTIRNVLIIGAGDAGERLCREIIRNGELNYKVVGFIDDNKSKIGKKIHGAEVYANIDSLKRVIISTNAKVVMIAIPSANHKQMRAIVEVCKENSVEFKTVPTINEIINNKISLNQLRDVSYKDILGRSEVSFDKSEIVHYLHSKVVFVTGAAGSIGSELCKQIARFNPKSIVLFDMTETPLFYLENQMKELFPYLPIYPVLGDVKDANHLSILFRRYKPDIIFHAAAYKHVRMMELQPWKAVENNLFGTRVLVEMAKKHSVGQFVLISTDKAVNPTSIMGASKKLAEVLVQGESKNGTIFSCVRFGNVLGSAGSVIPIFENQIKEGKPITITHPDVERFFMTIPEACLLVIQAGALSAGGEIFVLEMGKMKKILDIAHEMIKFHGFVPNRDIEIKYIGLRKGEKLYEELNTEDEKLVETGHLKIKKVKSRDSRRLSEVYIEKLRETIVEQNRFKVFSKVKEILPEFKAEV